MGILPYYRVSDLIFCFWQWNSLFEFNKLLTFIADKSGSQEGMEGDYTTR